MRMERSSAAGRAEAATLSKTELGDMDKDGSVPPEPPGLPPNPEEPSSLSMATGTKSGLGGSPGGESSDSCSSSTSKSSNGGGSVCGKGGGTLTWKYN